MKHPAATSPVSVGEFDDGPDAMLWHPDLSPARWRRETLRAALSARVVLCGLLGVAFISDGIAWQTGLAAMLTVGLGVVAVGSATFASVVNAECFGTDHVHDRQWRCRLEQRPGEFFYRSKDFVSVGSAVYDLVLGLLDVVHELHTTPARAWLPVEVPREAHRAAWEALCCLDRTRTARVVADQLRRDDEASALATQVNETLSGIDQALSEVLRHLRHCLTLAQAWTTKLEHADLETRVQDMLSSLRGGSDAARIAASVEALSQNVFAFVTAARDVTGAGPFSWEKATAHSSSTLGLDGDACTETGDDTTRNGGRS